MTEGRLLVIFLLVNNVGGRSLKFTRLSRCVNRRSKNYLLRFEQESPILKFPRAVRLLSLSEQIRPHMKTFRQSPLVSIYLFISSTIFLIFFHLLYLSLPSLLVMHSVSSHKHQTLTNAEENPQNCAHAVFFYRMEKVFTFGEILRSGNSKQWVSPSLYMSIQSVPRSKQTASGLYKPVS